MNEIYLKPKLRPEDIFWSISIHFVIIYVFNKVHELKLTQIIFELIRMILNKDWRNLEEEKVWYVTFSG